jgi:hypothetical protein
MQVSIIARLRSSQRFEINFRVFCNQWHLGYSCDCHWISDVELEGNLNPHHCIQRWQRSDPITNVKCEILHFFLLNHHDHKTQNYNTCASVAVIETVWKVEEAGLLVQYSYETVL